MLEKGDAQKAFFRPAHAWALIRSIPTCKELLDGIKAQAEAILKEKFGQMTSL
jgi:hypothetical protein